MTVISTLSPKRKAFLAGTLLLAGTGFACRVLGFFYRIFLSRTIGAEGLGLFHMMHPVFGLCLALCAGSMQTALSQYVASHTVQGRSALRTGLAISLTLAILLAVLVCRNADFLAVRVLMEPRCAPYLPLMGLSVPFAAFHACLNGYYYGMQHSRIPAFSQVAEQMIRMALVWALAASWTREGRPVTVLLAVMGHLAGEAGAAAFTLAGLWLFPPQAEPSGAFFSPAAPLLALSLPLMANRLILNFLASLEAVWIPNCLQMSGLSAGGALSLYGVLTGMAMPFILFPSAITNSMAVLLLPSVARDQAEGRRQGIASSISLSLRLSLAMGILCIGVFTLFGDVLGMTVFHSRDAGQFLRILGWLCPFLYLATTMGSILNGLGHTRTTFLQNAFSLLLRIGFVLAGIPRFGILAYLWGMLASELTLALLHLWSLKKRVPFTWNAWEMIVKPALFLTAATGIHYFTESAAPLGNSLPPFAGTAIRILFFCFCYGGLLAVSHFAGKAREAK